MSLSRDRKKDRMIKRPVRGEDVDPMNYLSNLADAMLVLAVGIMVALVLHWNVELTPSEMQEKSGSDTFTQEDLSGEEDLPEGAKPAGEVYYDEETGSYYLVRESGGVTEESEE